MRRFNGVPCDNCGCKDTERIGKYSLLDGWEMYECNHCGNEFPAQSDPEATAEEPQPLNDEREAIHRAIINNGDAVYDPRETQCPVCQSRKNKVVSSPQPQGNERKRYHKCDDCQNSFCSIELLTDPVR